MVSIVLICIYLITTKIELFLQIHIGCSYYFLLIVFDFSIVIETFHIDL